MYILDTVSGSMNRIREIRTLFEEISPESICLLHWTLNSLRFISDYADENGAHPASLALLFSRCILRPVDASLLFTDLVKLSNTVALVEWMIASSADLFDVCALGFYFLLLLHSFFE